MLMLLREVITVYAENYTKPMNTLCGQIAGLLNVKVGGRPSDHQALKFKDVAD
jgi:hypothetical protein